MNFWLAIACFALGFSGAVIATYLLLPKPCPYCEKAHRVYDHDDRLGMALLDGPFPDGPADPHTGGFNGCC